MSVLLSKLWFLFCLLEISHSFEIGTLYRYSYATVVLLNEKGLSHEKSSHRDVGHKITTEVLITPLWQSNSNTKEKLLKLELEKRQLYIPSGESSKPHSSTFGSVASVPIYILWNHGDITDIFVSKDDNTNIKKGIASILQLKTEDTETFQTDISGECKVVYKVNGKTVQKRKLDCRHPQQSQHYSHPNKVQTPSVLILSKTDYELLNEEGAIKNANGKEYIQIDSSLWNGAAMVVQSKYELILQSQEKTSSEIKGENIEEIIQTLSREIGSELVKETIIANAPKITCKENCKSLPILVKEFRDQLKDNQLASFKSASVFVKLLETFRSATKQDLLKVMKNTKNKNIVPQILDFISAAQTPAAWEAAIEYLDFTGKKKVDLTERFLLGLSMALHPTDALISNLLKLTDKKIKDEKLETSLVMTLASISGTYCKLDSSKCSSPVISEVSDYLTNNLNGCNDNNCKLLYLRGLKNAALPSTVPLLLKYVKQGKPFTLLALQAIKTIGPKYFSETVITILKEVYYQTGQKHDSTTRILAAELLISSQHSTNIIKDLIHSLAKEDSSEISTYITSKMLDLCKKDEEVRSFLKDILKNTEISNYHIFAQNGNSAVFTKPLSVGTGVNITYGMEMEMIYGGLLKQSAVNVDIQKKEDTLRLISIGLFAEGLCSIAGDESCSGEYEEKCFIFNKYGYSQYTVIPNIGLFAEGLCSIAGDESCSSEEEETTAGMELTVLGIGIRPYNFFHGTTELMGHVWSGTGSDPISALQMTHVCPNGRPTSIFHGTTELMGHVWSGTGSDPISALQANLLLIDHSQIIALQNGFVVDVKIQGAFSVDLSASIEISLWNRNSHSVVHNSGAFAIEGKVTVDTFFAESKINFNLGGESYIDFITDFDFYNSPFRTCLQMNQPDLTIMYDVKKTQAIPNTKHKVQITSKRKYFIPGKSYSFHQKNFDVCSVLLSQ